MAIDETVVRRLEQLAALRLADDERRRLAERLARVVAYVEQLRELDPAGLSPGAAAGPTTGPAPPAAVPPAAAPPPAVAAPRRADEPRPSLPVAEALAPSRATARGFFTVPPVLGEDGADG